MASIRKRGKTFQITVSRGYNSSGKRITETTTFVPEPGWSEKRALRGTSFDRSRTNISLRKHQFFQVWSSRTLRPESDFNFNIS